MSSFANIREGHLEMFVKYIDSYTYKIGQTTSGVCPCIMKVYSEADNINSS